MIETVPGLKAIPVLLNGGINEIAASDSLLPEDAIKMLNWRLSKDGTRIQKRAGLQEEGLVAAVDDVYGYSTYVDSTPNFCQLAVLEGQLMQKVGAGAWTQIYDWPAAATIDHVVKPLEIQGKQFIITEKGSREILADGTIRQIGITAPTSVPTAVSSYSGGITPPLDEHFAYADTAALTAAGWVDLDTGGLAASTIVTADPDAVPGPDADTRYLRLQGFGVYGMGTTVYAQRQKYLTEPIPATYSISTATYNDISSAVFTSSVRLIIDNGINLLTLYLGGDGAWARESSGNLIRIITVVAPPNKWVRWDFSVKKTEGVVGIFIEGFCTIDNIIQASGSATIFPELSTDTGVNPYLSRVMITSFGTVDSYVDYIHINSVEPGTTTITGLYRYAVSFIRYGNYGCESNPLKSTIGTITFTGGGLNDMTLSSESSYTGSISRTIRVNVKTQANPDIIQWSEDGGVTWKNEIAISSKIYLGYGIVVNFGAVTGHIANNYWQIPCTSCSVITTNQQVTLSSIPTSSDTQVTGRKIYRTVSSGSIFYYLTTIHDRATTTTFVDSVPDSGLGEEMEEDRDLFTAATIGVNGDVSTTIGKFSEWWDNRLWIADHIQNVIYYSAVRSGGGVPEEFSITDRFVSIRKGDQGDVITAMIAFKDALYVFKRNDIFIIQKTYYGYGVYHLNSDVGCIADAGVIVANDLIMFPSERGIELYDGVKPYTPEFSLAVNKTFLSADPTGYKYMSMVHDKEYNEVWLSIPSRVSSGTPTTIVWNYIKNKFYLFQFYKIPSCLVSCKDSTGKRVVKMGTRDGYVLLCDYGTADNATAITATYRKGWMDMEAHGIARLLKVKYELPAAKTITANIYVDMDKDVFRTAALTGVTPAATDIDLRRIIGDKAELGTRNRWLSVEFTNAEDCGGECKINAAFLFVRPNVIKNKTYAD
jgi:hypothetical protein